MSDLIKTKELCTKLLSFSFDNKLTPDALNSLLETGFNDSRYPSIIVLVCKELSMLYGIEERLNPMQTEDDIETFLFELNVLGCATSQLLDENLMTHFLIKEARILLLEFLLSHERLKKRKTEMEALASIIIQLNVNTTFDCGKIFFQLKTQIHTRLRQFQNRPDTHRVHFFWRRETKKRIVKR
uniref:Uncharacterized protein n=1 Tax=Acrobeloides nanus TaxID=290746 RepID=A0A914DAS6_9BILA